MFQSLVVKTLPNGLRIVVVPDAHAKTVTTSVLVGVGSAYELPKENGISHFLEHMTFKGTIRRPTPKVLLEEIESLGALSNAFTTHEHTGYWIKGNPEHVGAFVDILSDIYLHSTFPEAEIQKEKGVVIEEINMYEDIIPYKVNDVLFELLYDTHPLARSILGTKKTVASFSKTDLLSYRQRHYAPNNTLIVFAGAVTLAKAVQLARRAFSKSPKGKKIKRKRFTQTQTIPKIKIHTKQSDQAHLALAFRSFPLGHKDGAVLRVIGTILGKGMSARLPLILRDELGASYYVSAGQESFVDQGIFTISAGIDKARLREVTKRILTECARLKTQSLSDDELKKAKEFSIGALRLGLELSDDVASFYGAQMVLNQKTKTPEQVISAIRKVTTADIKRVARVLFQAKKANLAVVGPFDSSDITVKDLALVG